MAASVVLLLALLLAGTSPMGASWRIGAGLFLLGVGWSMSTVAASALLSESAPDAVRTDVQGAADLVMGLVAAAAGALAGLIVGVLDYAALTLFAALLAAGVATAAELARRTTGPRPAEDEPVTW
jgi:MFS family permease